MKYIYGLKRLPLMEWDKEGNERINIINGLGVVGIRSSGETNYLLKDHLGSTRMVIGEGGDKVGEFDYKDFGETKETVESGKSLEEIRYRYTGQEWDEELKQYNYLAREYDPRVGRFGSIDPAREGFSPYAYVGNNPINFNDPDGKVKSKNGPKKGIITKQSDGKSKKSSIDYDVAYRAIHDNENFNHITAKNRKSHLTEFQHVAGKTNSSWISVTHDEEVAKEKYASKKGYKGYIKIDFKNLPDRKPAYNRKGAEHKVCGKVTHRELLDKLDLTKQGKAQGAAYYFANTDKEALVRYEIEDKYILEKTVTKPDYKFPPGIRNYQPSYDVRAKDLGDCLTSWRNGRYYY